MAIEKERRMRITVDLVLIGLFIGVLTVIHYSTYHYAVDYHILLQFGYYLPVIYAAVRFGSLGGILSGLMITGLFLPHLASFQHINTAAWYTQWVEIFLINGIGWLTGFLSQQERKITLKYKQALDVQNQLVEQLREEGLHRQRLEEEMRRTERLKALGHLSAGLAHEIRNPLGIIRVTAQLLTEERSGDTVVAEHCQIIQEESGRLNRLVSEFLSFARPKEPVRRRIPLKDIVHEVDTLIQPLLQQKKIKLEQRLDKITTQVVAVDLDQIKQAFLNVLLNAIEAYEGKAGTITLEGILPVEGFAGIAVQDQGHGISPEALPYIYDPFFTTKVKGSGLGLSVVHQILDQHGGKITLTNLPSGGVRAEILLPVVTEEV